jgi:hypothetical protein
VTSKDKTGLEIIAIQRALNRLLNAIFGVFSFLIGTSAFMAAIFVTPLPASNNLYAIPWILMGTITVLALSRNIIIGRIFRKISRSRFLSLVYFGRIATYIIAIFGVSFFIIGLLSIHASLVLFSVGLFFNCFPIFLIFSEPMTYAGEIRLLFELLLVNLNNYENRQPYLRTISKKLENQLKIANVKVPYYEFIYHFNKELLKGTDIWNDLRNIESWMIDKRNPCFDSLKKIYPEDKLEPCKRYPLSRQLVQNPTIRNYILFIAITPILIATSPDLRNIILNLFFKLLGI